MNDLHILVTAPYFLPVLERYQERFRRHGLVPEPEDVGERAEEDELLRLIPGMDGVICGDDRFTEKVLERANRLQVISKWGTGVDSIDIDACRKRGIVVCNTPDAFSNPVADTVLGYILCFARRVLESNRVMKSGGWEKLKARSLSECTVGIVGVGNIGGQVAERLSAFGADIVGNDIRDIDPTLKDRTGLESMPLDELLAESEFVSLNCDLNETSFGLIGRDELKSMKPDSVIINTSRGPVINQTALVRALQKSQIAGAALDVFEEEPLPSDSPLRQMSNVLLAPHNANSSPEAWESVHESTFENLVRALGRSSE